MAEAHVGVGGTPRNIAEIYLGLSGANRTCIEVYVGVNGVPRLAWSAGKDRLYATNFRYVLNELDPVTMTEVRASSLSGNNVGGIRNKLYQSDHANTYGLRRIDPKTFAVLASTATNFFYGADGMNYTLYACNNAGILSEINPNTFAIIRNSGVSNFVYGIGGTSDKLVVHIKYNNNDTKFYYLDPASLALLQEIGWSKYTNRIGGNGSYFYMTNQNSAIWKKDPNTWANVSYLYSIPYGCGIGGTKK